MARVVARPWRTRPTGRPAVLPLAQVARLILQPAGRFTAADRATLPGFLDANPLLAQGYQLKPRFPTLVAEGDPAALELGLRRAEASALPSFHPVARSVRQDDEASQAALTTPWSTGPGEGQIGRVQRSTRLGYGRATLDRLRPRIFQRRATPMKLVGRGGHGQHPVAASRNTATSGTYAPTVSAASKVLLLAKSVFRGISRPTNRVYKRMPPLHRACIRLRQQSP